VISVHQDTVEDLFSLEPADGRVFPAEVNDLARWAGASRVSLLTVLDRQDKPTNRLIVLEVGLANYAAAPAAGRAVEADERAGQ
jgi:hypothetical protein